MNGKVSQENVQENGGRISTGTNLLGATANISQTKRWINNISLRILEEMYLLRHSFFFFCFFAVSLVIRVYSVRVSQTQHVLVLKLIFCIIPMNT